jgi:hypothetical protein
MAEEAPRVSSVFNISCNMIPAIQKILGGFYKLFPFFIRAKEL